VAKKAKGKSGKAETAAKRTKLPASARAPKTPKGEGSGSAKKPIEQYDHKGKTRANIPPVGLVTPDTDPPTPARRTYQYDPHLDPQLVWAGKAERTSFEIPTVSLHVHERIDPRTIIEAVRSQNGNGHAAQMPLFGRPEENPPLRDAINFYDHKRPMGWKNRLIAGDSLLVMNSLLEKEGLGGQVQMVYIDPPYGIRYGSNFQPFVNKREVKDGSDEDLTQEPEMLKAFRDTWELGIHSYLTYLRDRLLLAKELLHESGSCFVQISDENLHHVRELMDDVFGANCFVVTIQVKKKGSQKGEYLESVNDYVLWYGRSPKSSKLTTYRQLFIRRELDAQTLGEFRYFELPDGTTHSVHSALTPTGERFDYRLSPKRLTSDYPDARPYRPNPLTSGGVFRTQSAAYVFQGRPYPPGRNQSWKVNSSSDDGSVTGMQKLDYAARLLALDRSLSFKRYLDDFGHVALSNWWDSLGGAGNPVYVVQTNTEVIQRCLLMTTDPGDLVLDPTCGSGTTAYVAEQWGRRWITTDTSRVAITLAKQRLMTATFDYYTLAHPDEGVGSGFKYKTVPHVTLKSIANNPEIREGMSREEIDKAIAKYAPTETLYDKPEADNKRARVTGPFTVEAVPAAAMGGYGVPEVRPIDPIAWESQSGLPGLEEGGYLQPDASIGRQGQTLRQSEWRAELLKTGIRGKGGAKIEFVRVEPLPGARWLSADGETREEKSRRVVVSFGPEHAPLEQRQVELAIEEARTLVPKPAMVVFASLQFDPEASKDIDETNWPGVTLLKAQMNGDLVTEDLKKKRSSNESFWLVGQPDIALRQIHRGADAGQWQVEVHGFDYYNPKSGKVEPGGRANIAMWMLDTNYDGRSVYPRQVFFPLAGPKDGWSRLAKNLRAEIDQDLIEAYRGTVSLPFALSKHRRIAVKIVDDRGIESLRILAAEA
jgi:adenine-specific DNA-methyltransferase